MANGQNPHKIELSTFLLFRQEGFLWVFMIETATDMVRVEIPVPRLFRAGVVPVLQVLPARQDLPALREPEDPWDSRDSPVTQARQALRVVPVYRAVPAPRAFRDQ